MVLVLIPKESKDETATTVEEFPLGDTIVTKAGVLEIRDRGKTIQAYAPGRWLEAWVNH